MKITFLLILMDLKVFLMIYKNIKFKNKEINPIENLGKSFKI